GGAAGRAYVADDVAALHARAGLYRERRQVSVARRIAVAVREVDDVAVAVGPLGLDDDAVRRRAHGLSDRGADVDGVVRALLAGEWIGAAAEAVGEDAVHRRDRRRRAEELRLGHELLLQHGEVFVDLPRAERHLVDVVAIRILAEVGGTQTAHAALAAFIEA